jgi:hypothetical protein
MAWNQGNSVLIIAWDHASFGPLFRAVFRNVAAAAFSPRLQPLSLPTKLGYLKWIFGVKRREIIDFAVAVLKRGYPEVMVGECFGCEFQDGFGVWLR